MNESDPRPLAGVRVVDLSIAYAGPTCTRILSDLGADVIKVESMTRSDNRGGYMFPDNNPGAQPWNRGGFFIKRHTGKRSLTLELKTERGRAILWDLIETADVLVESYAPGVMRRWGFDAAAVLARNPRIIMVSISGYGQEGPRSGFRAYGMGLEAAGGLAILKGYRGEGPIRCGMAYLDPLTGMYAAGAVLSALEGREERGRGLYLDVSMQALAASLIGEYLTQFHADGVAPERLGNGHPYHSPCGIYRCQGPDDWLALQVCSDAEWEALCGVLGVRPPAEFAEAAERLRRRDEVDAWISRATTGWDKYRLAEALQAAGVTAGPVQNNKEVLFDRHLRARGFYEVIDQRVAGTHPYPRQTPVQFDGRYPDVARPSPYMGEHNEEVLIGEVGLTEAEVQALYEEGVIGHAPVPPRPPATFDFTFLARTGGLLAVEADYAEQVRQWFQGLDSRE